MSEKMLALDGLMAFTDDIGLARCVRLYRSFQGFLAAATAHPVSPPPSFPPSPQVPTPWRNLRLPS